MTIGQRYPVWYDSANQEVVIVERGYGIHWMMYPLIVGSGFFLLYGVGKIVVGVRGFSAHKLESACTVWRFV